MVSVILRRHGVEMRRRGLSPTRSTTRSGSTRQAGHCANRRTPECRPDHRAEPTAGTRHPHASPPWTPPNVAERVGMPGDDAYMFDGRCPTYVETVSCSGSCSDGMLKS